MVFARLIASNSSNVSHTNNLEILNRCVTCNIIWDIFKRIHATRKSKKRYSSDWQNLKVTRIFADEETKFREIANGKSPANFNLHHSF